MWYHLIVGCGALAALGAVWFAVQHWAKKAGCEGRVGGCCGGKDCDNQS